MCMKTPKPKKVKEKPVAYLSNPWLDDLTIGGTRSRASLVNDSGAAYVNPYVKSTPITDGPPDAGLGAGVVAPTAPRVGYHPRLGIYPKG